MTAGREELREAATVMVVRDDPGLEVLMVRRTLRADFVGGAHVFPGGAIDAADRTAEAFARTIGLDDATASSRVGVHAGGLAFWVAAVRECFEESGLLLARPAEASDAPLPLTPAELREYRRRVADDELVLLDVLVTEDLVVDASAMHALSHWVTPVGMPRRYDTWFFVAAAPDGQEAWHDESETVASMWVPPAEALARSERGEWELIFPTIRNLETIARFDTAAELLDATRRASEVPTTRPKIVSDGPGMRLLLPGDPGYDEAHEPEPGSIDPRRAAELDRGTGD